MLRVAMIGVIGVLVQTVIFEVAGIWLELMRASTASLLGAEMGVLTGFVLNNRYSFNDRSHAPLWTRLARYHMVVSGSLLIQWLCIFGTEMFTEAWLPLHAAYVAGILLGFISNYTGYRLWVWRHHEPTNATPPQTSL